MFEFLIAFALGVLSVLSPCVLPVVPLIFAGSRGKALNAVLIVLGLTTSMTITGAVAAVASIFPALRIGAYAFMAFFALALLSEKLEMHISARLSRTLRLDSRINALPSFAFGFMLAFIWLPCIAPLAGIAFFQSAVSGNPGVMLSYGLGMALTIGAALKLGEKIAGDRVKNIVKKVAGAIILIYALYFMLAEVLY